MTAEEVLAMQDVAQLIPPWLRNDVIFCGTCVSVRGSQRGVDVARVGARDAVRHLLETYSTLQSMHRSHAARLYDAAMTLDRKQCLMDVMDRAWVRLHRAQQELVRLDNG